MNQLKETRTIKISNGEIAMLHIGNFPGRPTIVFLHDSLGCIQLWRDFPNKLCEETQCNLLVYDRLGYGKSGSFTNTSRKNDYLEIEADVLSLLLQQQKINDAILFGHSDGGSIALIAAAKYPSQVKGAITEGAHIFVEEITLNGIRQAVESYRRTDMKERLEKYHGDKTDAVFSAWTGTWLSKEFKDWNIENFLPRIECPVLVIQGEKDEYGSLEQVTGIMLQVSGAANKLIIPSVGHTPHKDACEEVLRNAVVFIDLMTSK